jgi:RING-H2 zinc finger domain
MPTIKYSRRRRKPSILPETVRLVTRNITSQFYQKDTTVLEVKNNYYIRSIENCPNLSVVSLLRTRVKCIDNCPALYSLVIIGNSRLRELMLPSVRSVKLQKLPAVTSVKLLNATKAELDGLPSLISLRLDRVVDLSLSNMTFQACATLNDFPCLKTLHLINVDNFSFDGVRHIRRLKTLHIEKCNIEKLANINVVETITVEHCDRLAFVDTISNASSVNIDNCPSLTRVRCIMAASSINISRCNNLQRVCNIDTPNLLVEYCFSIVSIPLLFARDISVLYCPSFSGIKLSNRLRNLTIRYCDMFEFMDFDSTEERAYEGLKILLDGPNRIEHIKDWYASELAISNNISLETIANVYNLSHLSLTGCCDVMHISNMFIAESIVIRDCPALESITNICGVHTIVICECDTLKLLQIYLSEIIKFAVSHCHELNTTIDGSRLQELILIECGSILVTDINISTHVNTINAGSMPEISTDQIQDGNMARIGAESIRSRIIDLQTATNIVSKYVFRYLARAKYIKFEEAQKSNNVYPCAICFDVINPYNVSFTVCNHMFHSECIYRWLQVRRQCPLCNAGMP